MQWFGPEREAVVQRSNELIELAASVVWQTALFGIDMWLINKHRYIAAVK